MAVDLRAMCAADPLFFINAFGWTYDPRHPSPAIPFITYDYQDQPLLDLIAATGMIPGIPPCDIRVEKTRDMGASWLCIIADEYLWQFRDLLSFLWISRKEDFVDKPDDPKSLFWKLDFFISHLPPFLRPRCIRTRLHILNTQTKSTIDGDSTTGDVGRGDRRTRILLDEFASFEEGEEALAATADATDCRTFNSTPKGLQNAFYTVGQSNIKNLRFHWQIHPHKAAGLYNSEEGLLHIIDKEYDFPATYPFVLDGKLRSPWYDAQCERRPSRLEIAQELDIDYHASGSPFYDIGVLLRIEKEDIRPAYRQGRLIYDADGQPERFEDQPAGPLRLWTHLDAQGNPPRGYFYALGADISAGAGASNSCISAGQKQSGEKIAELTLSDMIPADFAIYCVALARWFSPGRPALMLWEANGPGGPFGKRVMQLGYRPIYYRRDETSIRKKVSTRPGWFATNEGNLALHSDHRHALASGSFINRSVEANEEAKQYAYTPTGVTHPKRQSSRDPSGARYNHGDRCKADALLCKALATQATTKPPKPIIPPNSFAGRRTLRRAQAKSRTYW